MKSNVPVVRQIAWISVIPQFAIMGLLMLIWYFIDSKNFILYGSLTYLAFSFGLKRTLAAAHRKGMACVKQQQFSEAIIHFQASYDFFTQHHWIDQYRFVTLLSSGRMSYKEMALNNIAFCYGQLGDGIQSKAYYEKTLAEFPNSGMAQAGLNLLNAAKEL